MAVFSQIGSSINIEKLDFVDKFAHMIYKICSMRFTKVWKLKYYFEKFDAERNELIWPRNTTQNVHSFFQELDLNCSKFERNATSFSWCWFFFFFLLLISFHSCDAFNGIACRMTHKIWFFFSRKSEVSSFHIIILKMDSRQFGGNLFLCFFKYHFIYYRGRGFI